MSIQELKTQLNTGSGTEGADCGPLTIINVLLWASDGKVGPRNQREVATWVKYIRALAHQRTGGFFVARDCLAVYNHSSIRYTFAAKGLKPPVAKYYHGLSWRSLRWNLKNYRAIHLAVDYGVLRAGNAPTGSDTFSGGHSLALIGGKMQRNRMFTNDGDPLFDGRRPGIPDGWRHTRVANFKEAAGAFGSVPPGTGKATCIVVKKG